MSRLSPEKSGEFRAACARMRNMPDFKLIVEYLKQRAETHKECLVAATPVDFPVFQGRAREVTDIINELDKLQGTAP